MIQFEAYFFPLYGAASKEYAYVWDISCVLGRSTSLSEQGFASYGSVKSITHSSDTAIYKPWDDRLHELVFYLLIRKMRLFNEAHPKDLV